MFRVITLVLLALPVLFVLSAVFGRAGLIAPTIWLVAIYSWVWLRFRPTQFVVHQDVFEVIWPLKRRQISRASISDVRIVNRRELKLQPKFLFFATGISAARHSIATGYPGLLEVLLSGHDSPSVV